MVGRLRVEGVVEVASSHWESLSRRAVCSSCVITCSTKRPGMGVPQQLGTDPRGPWVPALMVLRRDWVQSLWPQGSLWIARRWLKAFCGQCGHPSRGSDESDPFRFSFSMLSPRSLRKCFLGEASEGEDKASDREDREGVRGGVKDIESRLSLSEPRERKES